MRYDRIEDLPWVCRYNLPEAALRVYRDAYNAAWEKAAPAMPRDRFALHTAWSAVREHFARDGVTGKWVSRRR
jgi:cation transport regulator ChaB